MLINAIYLEKNNVEKMTYQPINENLIIFYILHNFIQYFAFFY